MRTEVITALRLVDGDIELVNVGMKFIDGDGKSIVVEIRDDEVEVRSGVNARHVMVRPVASNTLVLVPT